MSLAFNDWSVHLAQAAIQLKYMEHKLLNKDYKDIKTHAEAAKDSIDRTMAWLALQGADGSVDVLEVLQFVMDNNTHSKFHSTLLYSHFLQEFVLQYPDPLETPWARSKMFFPLSPP